MDTNFVYSVVLPGFLYYLDKFQASEVKRKSPHFGLGSNGKEWHLVVKQSRTTLHSVSAPNSICPAAATRPLERPGQQGQLQRLCPL
jgi:hypothetical protein